MIVSLRCALVRVVATAPSSSIDARTFLAGSSVRCQAGRSTRQEWQPGAVGKEMHGCPWIGQIGTPEQQQLRHASSRSRTRASRAGWRCIAWPEIDRSWDSSCASVHGRRLMAVASRVCSVVRHRRLWEARGGAGRLLLLYAVAGFASRFTTTYYSVPY
jgi:hypothetical protein